MELFDFKAATFAETLDWMKSAGEKPYRAKQMRAWVFKRGVSDFESMTDLSKSFREQLLVSAKVTAIKEIGRQTSSDGTIKFLWELEDGTTIESVWIPEKDRATLCVSTQVGCKLRCGFCLTGQGGFIRNLSVAEIVDQLVQARVKVPGERVTNIVLMGMGEPLDNYDNVSRALKVMTETDEGLIGVRKVTLSTAGVVPGILRLAEENPKIKLAISLNAPNDEVRSRIMPINKKYPLETLFAALKKWPLPQGRRITFEYVMLAGVNDSDDDARTISKLIGNLPAKINLIPFNPCPPLPYGRPSRTRIDSFRKILIGLNRTAIIRESRGSDISAACGQLRGERTDEAAM